MMSSKTCICHEYFARYTRETDKTYHASHTPYISTCAPLGAQNDLGGSVLSSLDIVGEVVADPAGVAEISNLDRDCVEKHILGHLLVGSCGRVGRVAEIDAGNVVCEYVPLIGLESPAFQAN